MTNPLHTRLAKEIAKAYKSRTFQECAKKSLEGPRGKVNFSGSVEHNLTEIMPEILDVLQKHNLLNLSQQ